MSTTSHKIDVGGLSLHVEDQGEGPAILFSHGVLCDGRIFDSAAAELARDHRVLVADLRGHGRSDAPSDAYSIRDVSKDFLKVLDALGIDRAVLAGHGVSGAAMLQVVLANPERASGLILINTTADEEAPSAAARARAFGLALQLAGPRKELLSLAARSLFSHTCHVAHPDIVERWMDASSGVSGAGVRRAIDMMVQRPTVDQRLERIETRTLVVAGSEDALTPKELQQRIVDRLPNARMKTIQRAGHLSPLEKPEELTEAIRQFVRELREGIRDDRTGRIIRQA